MWHSRSETTPSKSARRRCCSRTRPTSGASRCRVNASAVASTATRRKAGTGSRFPFSSSGSTGFDGDGVPHERQRRGADQDLARRRRLLEPGRDVDGIARDERLALAGHDLAGVDARAKRERDRQLLAERRQPLADLRHRAHGPQRIVLVRDRDAEHRHRRVADELLHRAAVPLHDQPDLLEVAAHRAPHRLGIEPLAERRRPGHVAEDDRHRLPHLPRRRGRGERRPAAAAEPEPVRALLATGGARGHAPSISAIASFDPFRSRRDAQTDRRRPAYALVRGSPRCRPRGSRRSDDERGVAHDREAIGNLARGCSRSCCSRSARMPWQGRETARRRCRTRRSSRPG